MPPFDGLDENFDMLVELTALAYEGPEKDKLTRLAQWLQEQVGQQTTSEFRATMDKCCDGDWFSFDRLMRSLTYPADRLIVRYEDAVMLHELAGYLMIRARLGFDSKPGGWIKPLIQDLNQYRARGEASSHPPGHKKTGS